MSLVGLIGLIGVIGVIGLIRLKVCRGIKIFLFMKIGLGWVRFDLKFWILGFDCLKSFIDHVFINEGFFIIGIL